LPFRLLILTNAAIAHHIELYPFHDLLTYNWWLNSNILVKQVSPCFLTPKRILANPNMGYQYALGGFVVSGLIFCAVAGIIKLVGIDWIDILLPPAAMGPIVALIGLELAGTPPAMQV
jgi:xanthine/uracil permease